MKSLIKRQVIKLKRESLQLRSATKPRRVLFDHLPKCGGSSLGQYLESHYPRRTIFTTNGSRPKDSIGFFKGLPEKDRYGFRLIKGHLTNELFDYVHPECVKVTVLRDPVERMISHYFYAKRTPKHYLYSELNNSRMSLECYITSNLSGELRNWYTTHFSGLSVSLAEKAPQEAISKAADTLLGRYDVIGFLDEFQLFIEQLRDEARLSYEYRGDRVNVGRERPEVDQIPQSAIHKIEQVNQLDVVLY